MTSKFIDHTFFISPLVIGNCVLILEAFAEFLHAADPNMPATDVLAQWLWKRLSTPPANNVDKVLHCEMAICQAGEPSKGISPSSEIGAGKKTVTYVFRGTSDSGKRLLKSLYEYCQSYDQQRWARWVHNLKASDFSDKLFER